MNAVVQTANTAVANLSDDPFAQVDFANTAREMGARDGLPFINFSGKTGEYTAGSASEGKEVPSGFQAAVDMTTMAHGWICWKNDEVVEEILVPILEGKPPAESLLKDHGPYKEPAADEQQDGWRKEVKINLTLIDCSDPSIVPGTSYVFKTSGRSPMQALANVLADFGKQYKGHPGEVPVLQFDTEYYISKKHPKRGKIYTSQIKIVGWISNAEYAELVQAGESAAPAAEVDPAEALRNEVLGNKADEGANDASNYEEEASTAAEPEAEKVEAGDKEAPPVSQGRGRKRF